jgi:hypothetical protein
VRGIFAVDPGESTGIAWGIINEKKKNGMSIEIVRERIRSSSNTITGTEAEQAKELYNKWVWFKRTCVNACMMDPEWIDLVVEDFVLFPGEKPGRSTTTPERISWCFEGYRMAMRDSYSRRLPKHYTPIMWQKSGAAKRYSKQDILKKADAWIVGRQHERSAFAHMILRTNVLLDRNIP